MPPVQILTKIVLSNPIQCPARKSQGKKVQLRSIKMAEDWLVKMQLNKCKSIALKVRNAHRITRLPVRAAGNAVRSSIP